MTRSTQNAGTRRTSTLLVAGTLLAVGVAVVGASTASAAPISSVFTVDARSAGDNGAFFNTGIVLPAGGSVNLSASGTATVDDLFKPKKNANGFPGTSCGSTCTLPGAPFGALVVKIGTAPPVVAGTGPISISGTGPVLLGYNDSAGNYAENAGAFQVTATFDNAVPAAPKCFNLGSACIPIG